MANPAAPLYGRLEFPAIAIFVERLRQIEESYLSPARFSAYLTTRDGESHYGLNNEDLVEVYAKHTQKLKSLVTSCSTPENRSVGINVRFSEKGVGELHYVIAGKGNFEKQQICRMLLGEWTPLSPEQEEEERKRWGDAASESAPAEPEPKKQETQPALTSAWKEVSNLRDQFALGEEFDPDALQTLLENISTRFLDSEPFNVRFIARDGQPYTDIGQGILAAFYKKSRPRIIRIHMDAATREGQLVDISLDLSREQRQASIEIVSTQAAEIKALSRKNLEPGSRSGGEDGLMHELFSFDAHGFQIERVVQMMMGLSAAYLERQQVTAFLSTLRGQTFPSLTVAQLLGHWNTYQTQISLLVLSVNHPLSGQTLSLTYQFPVGEQPCYGSLSMRWGSAARHQEIRQFIWQETDIQAYQTAEPEPSPAPLPGREMVFNPVFAARDIPQRPHTALILMPLDTYWSDTLWQHLQQTLAHAGWDAPRGVSLYYEGNMEQAWLEINAASLVIADLTYKHADVFYRIGLAHALGKRVIILSQHARDIPPDFLRFQHVLYENHGVGIQLLGDRLTALLKVKV
ncbi:MAG: hypothetical protein EAZ89_11485 [Bacteroidetes bacterium]|nr:MAG: hypothetical protein EAZ89_11485 [Bacteroidota bacterium]